VVFLGAYGLYTAGRWLAVADLEPAREHAHDLLRLERALGIAVERSVQDGLDGGALRWLLSYLYLGAQLVVVPAALLWLYRRSFTIYRRLRDTVIATWALAIPIHAAFPVAPPRLAGMGMTDVVSQQAAVGMTGRSTMFYNQFAAMPSLHCGFACAVGLALAVAVRGRPARVLALLWGPIVCVTVVATGNHYVVDVVAGIAVSVLGFVARPLASRLWAAARRTTAASGRARPCQGVVAGGPPMSPAAPAGNLAS